MSMSEPAQKAWAEYANRRHMHSHARIPSKDFMAGFAAGGIHALEQAATEIYNGAPDPCQAFYNYGLHPWLMDRAKQLREDSQ